MKKIQLKEFRELCDLRLALESHAAGLAARNRSDADLHEIRFALEAMRRMMDSEEMPAPGAECEECQYRRRIRGALLERGWLQ